MTFKLQLNRTQAAILLRVVGILLSGSPRRLHEMREAELELLTAIRDELARFFAEKPPQKTPLPKQSGGRGPKELAKLLALPK